MVCPTLVSTSKEINFGYSTLHSLMAVLNKHDHHLLHSSNMIVGTSSHKFLTASLLERGYGAKQSPN